MGIKERMADEVGVSAEGVLITNGKLKIQKQFIGPPATDYTQVGDANTALLASKTIYNVLGRMPKTGTLKYATVRANTVGVAGATFDIMKVASGTAIASAAAIVTQIAGTAFTAFTDVKLTVNTDGTQNIAAGSLIVAKLVTGGAETLSPPFIDLEIWL